jgi:hypothetical protein
MARGQAVPLNSSGLFIISIVLPGFQAVGTDVTSDYLPVREGFIPVRATVTAKTAPSSKSYIADILYSADLLIWTSITGGAGLTLPIGAKVAYIAPSSSIPAGAFLRCDVLQTDSLTANVGIFLEA